MEFPGSPELTARFRERLRRAFASLDLDSEGYCRFLPRLTTGQYTAAICVATVVLDSIGWSGCNSTLDALAHDLPVVTLPLEMMRSRHSAAILKVIGEEQTICADLDDYVEKAVAMASSPEVRTAIGKNIAANKGRLWRDRSGADALAALFVKWLRGSDPHATEWKSKGSR
jgi:predicted O-linked N-acetylglucosamine transferase (SPINDLY family)